MTNKQKGWILNIEIYLIIGAWNLVIIVLFYYYLLPTVYCSLMIVLITIGLNCWPR